MSFKLLNATFSTVQAGSSAIGSSSATGIVVATGDGAKFAGASTFDPIRCVIVDASTNPETIKEFVDVTARSTDTLTITRQVEDSTAHPASTTTIQANYYIATVPTAAVLKSLFGKPLVVDMNAAPYNCKGGDNTFDNAAIIETAMADAVSTSNTTNPGQTAGVAILEFDATQGPYYFTRALQQGSGYNSQCKVPLVASGSAPITIMLRPKSGAMIPPQDIRGESKGGLVFQTTLTTGGWSATYGRPSMIGGQDDQQASPALSFMTLSFEGCTFRLPPNPKLAAINAREIDRLHLKNVRVTTTETPDSTSSHYATQPTDPCGVSWWAPLNNWDGYILEGLIECQGMYAGPAVAELMTVSGYLIAYECYVGLNVQGSFYHLAKIPYAELVRCPYSIAQVDASSGATDVANGLGGANNIAVDFTLGFEEQVDATWRNFQAHLLDSGNQLSGEIKYRRVLAGTGSVVGPPVAKGGFRVRWRDMSALPGVAQNARPVGVGSPSYVGGILPAAVAGDTFSRANSTNALGVSDIGAKLWTTTTWGVASTSVATFTGTLTGSNALYPAWLDSGLADCTVQVDVQTASDGHPDFMLLFRVTDANNLLALELTSGALTLYKRVSGTFTSLGTFSTTPGTSKTHTLKVVMAGTSLTCYLDGTSRITYNTTTGQEAATKHGIAVWANNTVGAAHGLDTPSLFSVAA